MTIPPFETTFAVPMTCESCVKDISGSLSQLSGTTTVVEEFARSNPWQESTKSRLIFKSKSCLSKASRHHQPSWKRYKPLGVTQFYEGRENQTVSLCV